jgi:hypothetical protein
MGHSQAEKRLIYPIADFRSASPPNRRDPLTSLYVGYRTEEAVKKRDRSNWTSFGRTMSIR